MKRNVGKQIMNKYVLKEKTKFQSLQDVGPKIPVQWAYLCKRGKVSIAG